MIDINCDVGEGLQNESVIMPFISSCNIACGAHAGNIETMDNLIKLALQNNVLIGAHPSFPDKENFGRKIMDIPNEILQKSIEDQLQLFKIRANLQKAEIHHVKPHGALYNLIAIDTEKAAVVVNAISTVFKSIKLYVPYNSAIEKIAKEAKIKIVYEAFADRNYNDDLTLVSRGFPYAVISDKEKVLKHVKRMSEQFLVRTVQDNNVIIKAETFCVHGDNKNVGEILRYLHEQLGIQ